MLMPTAIGLSDVLQSNVSLSESAVTTLAPVEDKPVDKIVLRHVRKELPDEDIRRVALVKLQALILDDPYATQLGASIANQAAHKS